MNTTVDEMCAELTHRLDDLEASLPDVPAKALALGRASVHRVSETASAVAADVSRQLGELSSTASSAFATTVGQARSAVERTSDMATRTARESAGQFTAQSHRTAQQTERAAVALLDDATRAVDADEDRPAALEDWTKQQLYERAQDLDLEGRSTMSKKQLVQALRAS